MRRHNSYFAILLMGLLAITAPALAQENLLTDDAALVRSVMPSNWEVWRVLSHCKGLRLHRFTAKGLASFRIDGVCRIRNPLAPDEDCLRYALNASGTVDTPTNATIRKVTLRLLCSG